MLQVHTIKFSYILSVRCSQVKGYGLSFFDPDPQEDKKKKKKKKHHIGNTPVCWYNEAAVLHSSTTLDHRACNEHVEVGMPKQTVHFRPQWLI